jgi:hypothetical protein
LATWIGTVNDMVSFRSKIGSWLALTALALQLMLSSAHVHLTILHSAEYRTAITGTTVKTYKLPTPEPADSSDYCAVCASIQLAASTVLPQVPQLPKHFEFGTIQVGGNVALAIVSPRRTAFQSRAPPLA